MTTDTAEIIEGTAVEVEPQRAMVPVQPGQAIVTQGTDTGPVEMLARATAIATALASMVEAQKLYTVIRTKKYPHVEAWMTIGRMDNVVAREASRPEKNDDGSWEAFVELVRLSDGVVIGAASAMAGGKGDGDWTTRPDHVKRSMAVTRATSRAFRQQYAWIMTLAGYQPTPADEMPPEGRNDDQRLADDDRPAEQGTTHRDGLIGKAIAQGIQDFALRQGPDGPVLPFRIKEGRLSQIAVATGAIATALDVYRDEVLGQRVTVWGHYTPESFDKGSETITYKVLHVERIKTPAFEIPSQSSDPEVESAPAGVVSGELDEMDQSLEAESAPLFELDPEERAAVAGTLP